MPKSRGRRPRNHHRRRVRPTLPPPQASAEDLRRYFDLMRAVDAAEARGDARTALALTSAPLEGWSDARPFWRPWRTRLLQQVVTLGPLLPRWGTSRWILSQALQCIDDSGRSRSRRALQTAIDARGGPGTLYGVNEADAECKVVDHDWVFRQVHLYELGGLDHFVRRVASPDLVVGADRIQDWAHAPMGGFRLLRESGREVVWESLGTGEEIAVPNLGSGLLLLPGDCAIGRIVPIEEGAMFETAPLPVPDALAEQVGRDPGDWIAAVRTSAWERRGTDSEVVTWGLHDFSLLTDVPEVLWRAMAHHVVDRSRTGAWSSREGDLQREAVGLVRLALRGELVEGFESGPSLEELLPAVSASLVEPGVRDQLLGCLDPQGAHDLRRLAHDLPAPASEVCLQLARDLRETA